MTEHKVHVLVVGKSISATVLLYDLLEQDEEFEIIGRAGGSEEALQILMELQPDLVVVWLLPGWDASTILSKPHGCPVVFLASQETRKGAMRLLSHSGVGVLPLPSPELLADPVKIKAFLRDLKACSHLWAGSKGTWSKRPRKQPPRGSPPALIAIGSSSGAVVALEEILGKFPTGVNAAILITHHVSPEYQEDLVRWLSRHVTYRVKLACDGEEVTADTIYLAPAHTHLCVRENGRILLSHDPPVDGFRPSATRMFESLARHAPGRSIGIILSGMGRDGAAGLLSLAREGGSTIAQDESSSRVFGMPKAAIEIGAARHVLRSREIADVILKRLEEWNG